MLRLLAGWLAPMLLLAGCSSATAPTSISADRYAQARTAARAFLDRYVDPDGRVVRRDQGGDTVSEGVSYALLLAQVARDPGRERAIWAWAREHLRRPDGLLSYRAAPDGSVVDRQAASDADLVVAWALGRSADPALRADAAGLRSALRRREVVRRGPGPLLTAGPWATGEPATLNPSYWVLPALRATGLTELIPSVGPALASVTADGALLPPDWARLDGSTLRASPDPGGRFPQVRYSLDAQRSTIWSAVGCDAASRRRAAEQRPLLQDRPEALARDQRGAVLDPAAHPLPLVAAAAAAGAAADTTARDALLDRAAEQDRRVPTYYGAAWVALGRTLLQTTLLDTCQDTS